VRRPRKPRRLRSSQDCRRRPRRTGVLQPPAIKAQARALPLGVHRSTRVDETGRGEVRPAGPASKGHHIRLPRRAATLLLVAVALGLSACGGDKVLRTSDDVRVYIDEVVRGGDVGFTVADDAVPALRAAQVDTQALEGLDFTVRNSPGACDVVALVSAVGEVSSLIVQPVALEPYEQEVIRSRAVLQGVPEATAAEVLDLAVAMSQSTWVEAADKFCNTGI
jgi:hypothetical protein